MSDFKAEKYSPAIFATVRWSQANIPDKYGKYTIVLTNLSDAGAAEIEALGIPVRGDGSEADVRGKWIKVSHKTPITLKFAAGVEDPGYPPPNGSLATICVFPYSGSGRVITPKLASITITALAEKYVGSDDREPL